MLKNKKKSIFVHIGYHNLYYTTYIIHQGNLITYTTLYYTTYSTKSYFSSPPSNKAFHYLKTSSSFTNHHHSNHFSITTPTYFTWLSTSLLYSDYSLKVKLRVYYTSLSTTSQLVERHLCVYYMTINFTTLQWLLVERHLRVYYMTINFTTPQWLLVERHLRVYNMTINFTTLQWLLVERHLRIYCMTNNFTAP